MLDCGACVLRPWREEDVPSLARYADSYEVWRCLRDRFPLLYTQDDAEWRVSFARSQDPQTNFAVEADGEAVGGIGLELQGDDVERCPAETGYGLGEAARRKGMATAAVRALTAYGFEAFGLTRIYAVPFANNPGSARVPEKAGYARAGVMRRGAIKEGVVLDQIPYAVTDGDPKTSGAPMDEDNDPSVVQVDDG